MNARQAKKIFRCGWCCTHNFFQLGRAETILERKKRRYRPVPFVSRTSKDVFGDVPFFTVSAPPIFLRSRWGRWDWRPVGCVPYWADGAKG